MGTRLREYLEAQNRRGGSRGSSISTGRTTSVAEKENEALIKELRSWGRATSKQLLYRLAQLQLMDKLRLNTALESSISSSVKSRRGEVESVGFSFLRQGIFLEHGVGKNRTVGSQAAQAAARPWLKPILEPAVEELADILAEEYADIALDNIRLLIPGIIDTEVQGRR
jgi:hypothetical protein